MAEALFPVFEVPELISKPEQVEEKYKPSVMWDIENGDFVRDGADRLVECSGREAYKIWCYKVVNTERYACLAYPNEIGVEMDAAMKEPSNEATESAVERTITEALMVNPRTEYVRGFSFSWHGDALQVSFVVKGINWEEIPLSVTIGT